MQRAPFACILIYILSQIAVDGGTYYVSTKYSSKSCSGAYIERVVSFIDTNVCLPYSTGSVKYTESLNVGKTTHTMIEQRYSDTNCVQMSGPATVRTDAGLVNGSKCVADGAASRTISYQSTRPGFALHGIITKNYSTSSSCLDDKSSTYSKFILAGACIPFKNGTFVKYSCDKSSMTSEIFSEFQCRMYVSKAVTKFSSSCTINANERSYNRSRCIFASDPTFPPNRMQPATSSQAFVIRSYHSGSHCSATPVYYKVEPIILNKCLSPASDAAIPVPTLYSCKEGKQKFTVIKTTFANADTTCSNTTTLKSIYMHNFDCEKDEEQQAGPNGGYFVKSDCGPLPPPLANADQLILKEYDTPDCSAIGSTRSMLLGHCYPVYGPKRHGLPAVVEYRRKLVFVADANGKTKVQELRYLMADQHCEGSVTQSSVVEYVNGACQRDSLSPNVFINRVLRVSGLSEMNVPAWFMRPVNAPTFAPTKRPTQEPSFKPTKPTFAPTFKPSRVPISLPTQGPTLVPTWNPTRPTTSPTASPTFAPIDFTFTGTKQTYVVPQGVAHIKVIACGARGTAEYPMNFGGNGGSTLGGYIASIVPVTPGQTLFVYVGGWGYGAEPYYNIPAQNKCCYNGGVQNSGGASDVRTMDGGLDGSLNPASRIVVAGGGGSCGCSGRVALGGGLIAPSGECNRNPYNGGSQTAGGALVGNCPPEFDNAGFWRGGGIQGNGRCNGGGGGAFLL